MPSSQSDSPNQISEQGFDEISLSREQRAKIEDSPLLQPVKLEIESQTAQLASGTTQNITKSSSSFGIWWSELLAYGAAVCVFFVLVLTLRPFQGYTTSSWPLDITINTFVSICTLIIKALLGMILSNGISQLKWIWYRQARPLSHLQRYDSASRGVVGSLRLLWTHRGRQIMPTLGALLMIIITLADPFGQLLVRFENCVITDPSVRSTIAATHHADILDNMVLQYGQEMSASEFYVSMDAQALMTIGLLNETLIPAVSFECPTGNCSYPQPYHSSGYCSRCTDFSKQVTGPTNNTWRWEAKNMTLAAQIGFGDLNDIMAITMEYGRVSSSIASINIMGAQLKECVNNSTTPWRCQGYGAATCEIYACVISYTGEVNSGTLSEIITNTSAVWSPPEQDSGLGFLGSVDVSCLNTSELNALQQAGFDISPNTNWLAYNISASEPGANEIINEKIIRQECLYATDKLQLGSINFMFQNIFYSTVSRMPDSSGIVMGGPIQWQKLWNQGEMDFVNVQQVFNGLATSMTYYARNNPITAIEGVIGESYWNGTSYRDTTCVQIQWKWIIYLATTMIGVMVFLLGTVVMARSTLKENGQDYKTSILPLMFHGVKFADSEISLKTLKRSKEMIAQAQNIYVTFEATEDGWQFVEKKPA